MARTVWTSFAVPFIDSYFALFAGEDKLSDITPIKVTNAFAIPFDISFIFPGFKQI